MRIRTHIGVSADGFVSTSVGRPALLSMLEFAPGASHGHPEFIAGCGAVVMGRTTFDPAAKYPTDDYGAKLDRLVAAGDRTAADEWGVVVVV